MLSNLAEPAIFLSWTVIIDVFLCFYFCRRFLFQVPFRIVKRQSLINKTCRVTKKARRTEPFGAIPFLELFSSIIGAPNDPTLCLFKILTFMPNFLHTPLHPCTGGINAQISNLFYGGGSGDRTRCVSPRADLEIINS